MVDANDAKPPIYSSAQRRPRRLAVLLSISAVLGVLVVGGRYALPWIGNWLIVKEPLQPADAIFVHAGHPPFRALEAADLYRQGLAPEVWLASVKPTEESLTFQRIGVDQPPSWYWEQQVLLKRGVPKSAIRLLPEQVLSTADEIEAVSTELGRRRLSRVILVTSKQHSRRVRELWNHLGGPAQHALVAPSTEDPFDPERWWTNTEDGEAVVHELAGLVAVWLNIGIRPERHGSPETHERTEPHPVDADPADGTSAAGSRSFGSELGSSPHLPESGPTTRTRS